MVSFSPEIEDDKWMSCWLLGGLGGGDLMVYGMTLDGLI